VVLCLTVFDRGIQTASCDGMLTCYWFNLITHELLMNLRRSTTRYPTLTQFSKTITWRSCPTRFMNLLKMHIVNNGRIYIFFIRRNIDFANRRLKYARFYNIVKISLSSQRTLMILNCDMLRVYFCLGCHCMQIFIICQAFVLMNRAI
jgi:hypothetical protein